MLICTAVYGICVVLFRDHAPVEVLAKPSGWGWCGKLAVQPACVVLVSYALQIFGTMLCIHSCTKAGLTRPEGVYCVTSVSAPGLEIQTRGWPLDHAPMHASTAYV
jgi:hypothetical protein